MATTDEIDGEHEVRAYDAEQMFWLLHDLHDLLREKDIAEKDIQMRRTLTARDLGEGLGIGIGRHKLEQPNGYGAPVLAGYQASELNDPYTWVIDVRMARVVSQEKYNGEYVFKEVFWFAQHDGWDLSINGYIEQWYFRMQLLLRK